MKRFILLVVCALLLGATAPKRGWTNPVVFDTPPGQNSAPGDDDIPLLRVSDRSAAASPAETSATVATGGQVRRAIVGDALIAKAYAQDLFCSLDLSKAWYRLLTVCRFRHLKD